MTRESQHVSTTIDRSADEVYAYARDPANLSHWAAGLAKTPVHQVEGEWVADSPMGRVGIRFADDNAFGVLDHVVTLPDGVAFYNPMRVVPDGDGCEVVFTVRRSDGVDDTAFANDVAAVAADLAALRRILEGGAPPSATP